MKRIYQSATRLVLILLTFAAAIALFTGHLSEDTFKTALLMVLSFYFGKAQTVTPQVDNNIEDVLKSLKQ